MNQQDIDRIKAYCAKASAGPWKESEDGGRPAVDCPGQDPPLLTFYSETWGDAAFVASARTDLPAAIAEIERLRASLRVGVHVNSPTAVVFREFQCSDCGWIFGFSGPSPDHPLPTICSACAGKLRQIEGQPA